MLIGARIAAWSGGKQQDVCIRAYRANNTSAYAMLSDVVSNNFDCLDFRLCARVKSNLQGTQSYANAILGPKDANSWAKWFGIGMYNGMFCQRWFKDSFVNVSGYANQWVDVEFNKSGVFIDGVKKASYSAPLSYPTSGIWANFILGIGTNVSSDAFVLIRSAQIYDGSGMLLGDFAPFGEVGGEGGFINLVTGNVYSSATTTPFVVEEYDG